MNQLILGVFSGIVGAVFTGVIAWFIANRNSKQRYYDSLMKLIEQHNWNLKAHSLDTGLNVKDVKPDVSIVCYQHLNILFYAWLNKSIIEKDGSLEGWKNWANEIVNGASKSDRSEFRACYRQILTHGDIYPKAYLSWLDSELGLSIKAFREVT